jgi:GH25 family lysozyme M1 (1,4-beta-N-acetylmuramidase)
VPWDQIAASSSFAIMRACYGSKRDRACVEHVRRARAVGLHVGLYAFFRSTERPIEQLAAFRAAAEACGYEPGDIAPALDVEEDPNVAKVTPHWEPAVRECVDALQKDYGGCILYITAREWGMLGRPEWCLSLPLWVAHYRNGPPATPGDQPALIHQHRVGPYDPNGPGGGFKGNGEMVIDQNRAFGPLPLAARVPWRKADDGQEALRRAAVAAQEIQVDVVGTLRTEAMRKLAGLDTQPPDEVA